MLRWMFFLITRIRVRERWFISYYMACLYYVYMIYCYLVFKWRSHIWHYLYGSWPIVMSQWVLMLLWPLWCYNGCWCCYGHCDVTMGYWCCYGHCDVTMAADVAMAIVMSQCNAIKSNHHASYDVPMDISVNFYYTKYSSILKRPKLYISKSASS